MCLVPRLLVPVSFSTVSPFPSPSRHDTPLPRYVPSSTTYPYEVRLRFHHATPAQSVTRILYHTPLRPPPSLATPTPLGIAAPTLAHLAYGGSTAASC